MPLVRLWGDEQADLYRIDCTYVLISSGGEPILMDDLYTAHRQIMVG